jgi:hypothetical protein
MKISTATSVFVNYLLPEAIDAIVLAGFDGSTSGAVDRIFTAEIILNR